jgi:hypothetical protein
VARETSGGAGASGTAADGGSVVSDLRWTLLHQAYRRSRRELRTLRALMEARVAEERRLREHVEETCDQLRAELALLKVPQAGWCRCDDPGPDDGGHTLKVIWGLNGWRWECGTCERQRASRWDTAGRVVGPRAVRRTEGGSGVSDVISLDERRDRPPTDNVRCVCGDEWWELTTAQGVGGCVVLSYEPGAAAPRVTAWHGAPRCVSCGKSMP